MNSNENKSEDKDLLTLTQAAKQLNVTKQTIYNWVHTNKIEYVTLPNNRRRYKINSFLHKDEGKKKELEQEKKTTEKELYTQESLLENKQMTCNDRYLISEKVIQTLESSKTSEAELTTRKEDFSPWWNSWCQEKSQLLWLPTEIDSVDSDLNSWNQSSNSIKPTSWFSITRIIPKKKKWFKISFPSLQCSLAGTMVLENTNKKSKKTLKLQKRNKYKRKKKKTNHLHRTWKCRLYPTVEQRKILRKWFGTARYCYNDVISRHLKHKENVFDFSIREIVLENIPFEHKSVNLEVKRNAIKEAVDTLSAGGNDFRFRTRKDRSESIYVRNGCVSIKKNTIFPTTFGKISTRGKKLLPPILDGSRLVRKGKKYYLDIVDLKEPSKITFKESKVNNTICALDPGSHTFLDYYSPLDCGKIGDKVAPSIFRQCKRIDKLISKSVKSKSKLKYRLKRSLERSREKLKNRIDDLHWKAASFLCKKYTHIFLPHFETQKMCQKTRNRKIKNKTARNMLTLSHFLFSERLRSKAEETGTTIFKLNEPYTSQLCGRCFNLNTKLRMKDRIYKCSSCDLQIDRDSNAARNILLRGLKLLNECEVSDLVRWEVPPFTL